MKDHSKFYNWLRFMAIVSIVVGVFSLILLITSGAFVPRESDNLPSAFYAFPTQRIMLDFMILVSGLSGIAFGVCDFLCRLKAVGILAVVKAVILVGLCLVYSSHLIPFISIVYFLCGIYALKCNKYEINNLKLKTA